MSETDFHKVGRSSKRKGKNGELECSRLFQEHGFATHRTVQYNGRSPAGAADLVGVPGLWIEAKRREKMALYDWIGQTEHDHTPGTLPVVFHRSNNHPWLVSMTAETFFELFKNSDLYEKGGTNNEPFSD